VSDVTNPETPPAAAVPPTPPAPRGDNPEFVAPLRELIHNIRQFGEHWSWRCGVQWTRASEGWKSGACQFDHKVDSWDQLVSDSTEHLRQWHGITPVAPVSSEVAALRAHIRELEKTLRTETAGAVPVPDTGHRTGAAPAIDWRDAYERTVGPAARYRHIAETSFMQVQDAVEAAIGAAGHALPDLADIAYVATEAVCGVLGVPERAAAVSSGDTGPAPAPGEVVTIRITNHGPWHGRRAVVALDSQGKPPARLNIEPDGSITGEVGRTIGHLLDHAPAPSGVTGQPDTAAAAYADTDEHQELTARVLNGEITAKTALARLRQHEHPDPDRRCERDYLRAELHYRNRQYGRASETIGGLRIQVERDLAQRRLHAHAVIEAAKRESERSGVSGHTPDADVTAPIDWQSRFRAAAEVAEQLGWTGTGMALYDMATQLNGIEDDGRTPSPEGQRIAQAVGRALLGVSSPAEGDETR
jgi:hypothetical protein